MRRSLALCLALLVLPAVQAQSPLQPGPCEREGGALGTGVDAFVHYEDERGGAAHTRADEEALRAELRSRTRADLDLSSLLGLAKDERPNGTAFSEQWDQLWAANATARLTNIEGPCLDAPAVIDARLPGRNASAASVHVGLPADRPGQGSAVLVLSGSAPAKLSAFDRTWNIEVQLEVVEVVLLAEPYLVRAVSANAVLHGRLDWSTLGERVPVGEFVLLDRLDRATGAIQGVRHIDYEPALLSPDESFAQQVQRLRHENDFLLDNVAPVAGDKLEEVQNAYWGSAVGWADALARDAALAPRSRSQGDVLVDGRSTRPGAALHLPLLGRGHATLPSEAALQRFLDAPRTPLAAAQAFLGTPEAGDAPVEFAEALDAFMVRLGVDDAARSAQAAAFAPWSGSTNPFVLYAAGVLDALANGPDPVADPRGQASLLLERVLLPLSLPMSYAGLSQECGQAMAILGRDNVSVVVPFEDPQTAKRNDVVVAYFGGMGNDAPHDYRDPGVTNRSEEKPWPLYVDCAGDDRYDGAFGGPGAGVRQGLAVDLGGNDIHFSVQRPGLGAGEVGVGIFADFGGNDRWQGANRSLGFGVTGVGVLLDVDGDDAYSLFRHEANQTGGYYGMGAGIGQGVGLLIDTSGSDTYTIPKAVGQGATDVPVSDTDVPSLDRPSIGALIDLGGSDRYVAVERAQGSAGSLATGLGLLFDSEGDDSYTIDVAGQGWAEGVAGLDPAGNGALGVLYDAGGNDVYTANAYAQASANGGLGALVDLSGDDRFLSSTTNEFGCTQACTHGSLGTAVLYDGGGVDEFTGSTDTMGAARNALAGLALFISEGGADTHVADHYAMGSAVGGVGSTALHVHGRLAVGMHWTCATNTCGGWHTVTNAAAWVTGASPTYPWATGSECDFGGDGCTLTRWG